MVFRTVLGRPWYGHQVQALEVLSVRPTLRARVSGSYWVLVNTAVAPCVCAPVMRGWQFLRIVALPFRLLQEKLPRNHYRERVLQELGPLVTLCCASVLQPPRVGSLDPGAIFAVRLVPLAA